MINNYYLKISLKKYSMTRDQTNHYKFVFGMKWSSGDWQGWLLLVSVVLRFHWSAVWPCAGPARVNGVSYMKWRTLWCVRSNSVNLVGSSSGGQQGVTCVTSTQPPTAPPASATGRSVSLQMRTAPAPNLHAICCVSRSDNSANDVTFGSL